jgi:hypothetical protein
LIQSNSVSGIAFASGGGIANNGYLNVTNSSIDGNEATVSGGLDNGLVAIAELDHVNITNNSASLNTQGAPYGAGGGVSNSKTAEMTLHDARINDNRATSGSGGGIVNEGTLRLDRTLIDSNESGYWGGGILNDGSVNATAMSVSHNDAFEGGGIFNYVDGTVILEASTIDDNRAQSILYGGGGIRNLGSMRLANVTIVSNMADGRGGGISNGNASTVNPAATLVNVTLDGNQASQGGGIDNGGAGNAITLINTIVANSPTGNNCAGQLTSKGHNLDSGHSCGLGQSGDITDSTPHLYPLEDNGGFTQTERLGAGFEVVVSSSGPFSLPILGFGVFLSAAVDAGDSGICPPTDQRGVNRPVGSGCDIGAYEFP